MNRKGQSIGLNVVVIAAIALLVLVVIAVLVFRSGGQVGDTESCSSNQGSCQVLDAGQTCSDVMGESGWGASQFKCQSDDETCCIKILNN